MKYRNTKSGAIVDVKSELKGSWVLVEESKKPEKDAPKKRTKKEE